jgi:hypothetical protein
LVDVKVVEVTHGLPAGGGAGEPSGHVLTYEPGSDAPVTVIVRLDAGVPKSASQVLESSACPLTTRQVIPGGSLVTVPFPLPLETWITTESQRTAVALQAVVGGSAPGEAEERSAARRIANTEATIAATR